MIVEKFIWPREACRRLGIGNNSYIGAMKLVLGLTRRKVLLSEVVKFRAEHPNFNPKQFYAERRAQEGRAPRPCRGQRRGNTNEKGERLPGSGGGSQKQVSNDQ